VADTAIEWTDKTWNPTTGCDKVSPGCDHCYAMTMAKRLKGMGQAKYQNDGDPRTSGPGFLATEHESDLDAPLRWRKPARVFVNSMSDLFHERISDEFIARVWVTMSATPQHTYQVLTKRHGRMRSLLNSERFQFLAGRVGTYFIQTHHRPVGWSWPLPNVWLGVSVEDQKWADIRIPALLDTPAAVRFLSCEPLLGPVNLSKWLLWPDGSIRISDGPVGGIDWAIVGGESGPGARPMHPDWARSLRDQCVNAGVPFLHKQNGAWRPTTMGDYDGAAPIRQTHHFEDGEQLIRVGKKAAGRLLDGRTWDEFPGGDQ
jgi:protein gp37